MADDNNVRQFPRMGTGGPTDDPPDPAAEASSEASAAPVSRPDPDPSDSSGGGRRSPLESIAAMASPGLSDPVVTAPDHSANAHGQVPGTFRPAGFHEGGPAPQPGLGTLSVATILAVAVAAMRGIHTAITGVRANREQRKAAADLAASGRGDADSGRKGRMQSPAEFGRGFLGRPDRLGNWPRQGAGPSGRGGGGGGRGGGFGSLGWGGGSSSRRGGLGADGLGGRKNSGSGGGSGSRSGRSGGTGAGGLGADGSGGRKNSKSGGRGARFGGTGAAGSGGPGSGGDSSTRSGSGKEGSGRWWRGGSKRTSQRGTVGPRSKRGGKTSGADLTPGAPAGKGGTSPKTGGTSPKNTGTSPKTGSKGRVKSPKATSAPKGTLRPQHPKKPGVGAPGGPPPRKRRGRTVTDGSLKLPKGYFHGTLPGWEQGCRCPACTRAWAKTQTVVGSKVKLPAGVKHGSAAAFEDAQCTCKTCVKAAIRRNNITPPGRVTLARAVGNTLERRWAKRRKNTTPVIGPLSKKARRKAAANKKGKQRSPATATAAGPKVNLGKSPKVNLGKPPKAGSPPPRPTGPTGPAAAGPGPSGPNKHRRQGGGHWSRDQRRSQQRWEQRRAAHADPDDEFWFVQGPDGVRRTPWQSAGAATAGAQPEIHTVERLDKVGDQELRNWGPPPASTTPALGAAAPAGSTDRKETGPMSLPDRVISGLVTGMSSEHATEITLDDTLETLERLTVESFAAHETCSRLAEEARQIRYRLEDLAADLRTRHNVIGRFTAAAMDRLAESMEMLARKAEEMKVSSLDAAEMSEAAENAMFDAYKPVQQATADAGLLVPSARVHNEG